MVRIIFRVLAGAVVIAAVIFAMNVDAIMSWQIFSSSKNAKPSSVFNEYETAWIRCEGSAYPEKKISGCTIVIESGRETGKRLAEAFKKRGDGYQEKARYIDEKGQPSIDLGQVDVAIPDYDEAIRIDPSFKLAYWARATAYGNKSDHDRALADYEQVIRLDPNEWLVFESRGLTYNQMRQFDRAIADFDEVLRRKPTRAAAVYHRATAYARKQDYDHAIVDFDRAIELEPEFALAFNGRAVVYFSKGDYDRAIVDYDAAIRFTHQKYTYASLYGRSLAKQKKGDAAGGDADIAAAKALFVEVADYFKAAYDVPASR